MEKELREKIENAAVNLEWDEIEVIVVHRIAKEAYQLGEKSLAEKIKRVIAANPSYSDAKIEINRLLNPKP